MSKEPSTPSPVAPQETVECVALAGKYVVVQESLPASATHSSALHAVLWCYPVARGSKLKLL
jgi:hypothetical protein